MAGFVASMADKSFLRDITLLIRLLGLIPGRRMDMGAFSEGELSGLKVVGVPKRVELPATI